MRIATSTFPDALLSRLHSLSAEQIEYNRQLSSGQRIETMRDDPAAAVRVLDRTADKQRIAQYQQNANQALIVSRLTFSSLEYIKASLDEAEQHLTLPNGWDDSGTISDRLNEILEDAVSMSNSRHEEDYLFGGTESSQEPFQATRDADGNITAIAYVGTESGREYSVGTNTRLSPFTEQPTMDAIATALTGLIALRDGWSAQDDAAVEVAADTLATAEDGLLVGMGEVGLTEARIQTVQTRDEALYARLEEASSAETEIDETSVVVGLMQARNAYEGSLQSASQIINLSLLNFI